MVMGGMMVAIRFDNIDFPLPGGPISRRAWLPATATSIARLTRCCPFTSAKSNSSLPFAVKSNASWRTEVRAVAPGTRRSPADWNAIDLDSLDDGGFAHVCLRHNDRLLSLTPRLDRNGQDSLDRTNFSIERKLSRHQTTSQPRHVGAFRYRDHSDGNRQVKARSLLLQIRRSKVDGRARPWPTEAAIGDGSGHSVLALAHSGVGQTHQNNRRITGTGVDLDFDLDRLDALNGCRKDTRQHIARKLLKPIMPCRSIAAEVKGRFSIVVFRFRNFAAYSGRQHHFKPERCIYQRPHVVGAPCCAGSGGSPPPNASTVRTRSLQRRRRQDRAATLRVTTNEHDR